LREYYQGEGEQIINKYKSVVLMRIRKAVDWQGKKKPGAGGYTGLPHTKVLRSGEKPKDEVFKYKGLSVYCKEKTTNYLNFPHFIFSV
jgi:hypothetical protein